jgi:hypothetical protein
MDVGLAELQTPRHRREHRTKTLAVTAAIANLHLPSHFGLGRRHLTTRKSAGVTGQGFKRLHGLLLLFVL